MYLYMFFLKVVLLIYHHIIQLTLIIIHNDFVFF